MNKSEQEIRAFVESVLAEHQWADEEIQAALIEIARERAWRQGLWARLRFVVNIFGLVGVVAGAILALRALVGS